MGDLAQMRSDDDALKLAIEAISGEGLTSFQQVIHRAEAVKRERARIFRPLPIEVCEEVALTCEEMRAVVRQFYGELKPSEMDAIVKEYRPLRRELDSAVNEVENMRKQQSRARRAQSVAVAV